MSRLKLHLEDSPENDNNSMRFPTQWFDEDSQESASLTHQMLRLAEEERDLIGAIQQLQADAREIEDTLQHALHLAGHDPLNDPPTAA